MFVQIKSKSGKVLFQRGVPPKPVDSESRKVARTEINRLFQQDLKDMEDGKPSSKKGRDKYFSTLGFIDTPFFVLMEIYHYIVGTPVWYSENGTRICRMAPIVVNRNDDF